MTRMVRLTAVTVMLGASVALAACSSTGGAGGNPLSAQSNTEALRRAAPQAGTASFTGSLANEYLGLANEELTENDWSNADHFARKGLLSARGSAVLPDEVGSRSIPAQKVSELQDARQRLGGALDGGARERAPTVAARAQSRFDCWLEEQEENWQIDDIARCRSEFLAAMDELTARPAAAQQPGPVVGREYRVYFEFDRSNLTPEAQQIVNRVAQETERGARARLELVGKADRSGPEGYNQRLSERRARTVVDALVKDGIPRDRITSRAVGETQPPVPTPDGVREPRNRVVEINLR